MGTSSFTGIIGMIINNILLLSPPAGSEWIGIIGFLVIIGISILIFLALREFWAWYTKTNEMLDVLYNQTKLLREILKVIQENKQTNKNE